MPFKGSQSLLYKLDPGVLCVFSQDFSQGAMRLVVFFSCFSLELAQLILCCFADQRPHALKPGHVTVLQNSQTFTVLISDCLSTYVKCLPCNFSLCCEFDTIIIHFKFLTHCCFRTPVQLKMLLFSLKHCSGGSVGEFYIVLWVSEVRLTHIRR